jgi:hypothetical protein
MLGLKPPDISSLIPYFVSLGSGVKGKAFIRGVRGKRDANPQTPFFIPDLMKARYPFSSSFGYPEI